MERLSRPGWRSSAKLAVRAGHLLRISWAGSCFVHFWFVLLALPFTNGFKIYTSNLFMFFQWVWTCLKGVITLLLLAIAGSLELQVVKHGVTLWGKKGSRKTDDVPLERPFCFSPSHGLFNKRTLWDLWDKRDLKLLLVWFYYEQMKQKQANTPKWEIIWNNTTHASPPHWHYRP